MASPGSGLPPGPASEATSPTTEISGWPGTVRLGVTSMRPPRSMLAPVVVASASVSGTACTPAAQMTILVLIRSVAPADLDRHAALVDRGRARALAHDHPELGELPSDLPREPLAERSHQPVAGVEEDHPRAASVDPPEVWLYRVGGDGELTRDLDARRAAADDDERQQLGAFVRVIRALRRFEGAVEALSQVDGIRHGLQPVGDVPPLVVAEVGGLRAARHDQAVVVEAVATVEDDLPALGVHVGDLGH